MVQTYAEFADLPSSKKSVLAWIEPSARLVGWTLHAGAIYKIVPDFFPLRILQDGSELTEVASLAAVNSAGKWFFDTASNQIYLWANLSSNPDNVISRVDYRIFLSTVPIILPYNLEETGYEVEYLPLIATTSFFGHELDSEQIGIALEGQGSISLINTDGFWDDKFDLYFWENKPTNIWSWSEDIQISEKKKIYSGFIKGKQYSEQSISFEMADFIIKLRDSISLPVLSDADGTFPASSIGKPKRRIYGRVAGLRVFPLDNVLDGFELTGTISIAFGSSALTGVGSLFLDEVSPKDKLTFVVNDETIEFEVKSVNSDTSVTITNDSEFNLTAAIGKCLPSIPYRKKNRRWLIAGHEIKKIQTTVTGSTARNRINVGSIENFNVGDVIFVGAEVARIKSLSGIQLVLRQNLPSTPANGTPVFRYPVQSLNIGVTNYITERDYVLENNSESFIVFDDLAEFNITKEQPYIGTVTFTNASRELVGVGTQFTSDFKPRDWIRPINTSVWYEILEVTDDTNMKLRVSYAGGTVSSAGLKKNVSYIDDDAIVTIDCFGKTTDGDELGDWIKTASDVIKDLLGEIDLTSSLDLDSFNLASSDAPQTISLKLPLEYNSDNRLSYRECIDLVNKSVFGSLHQNSDFEIAFNIINARKPSEPFIFRDDDIIDWKVDVRSDNIVKEFICSYKHLDADPNTGGPGNSYKSRVNNFVLRFGDTNQTKTQDIYLYDSNEAELITQRYAFINETSGSRITLRTKLNMATKNLNDKIYLNLDRLYYRFGSSAARRKICLISAIRKNGLEVEVELDDIGNIFNRVATIAPNTANDFSAADDYEKSLNGYFTDNQGIVNNNKNTYRTNLIG